MTYEPRLRGRLCAPAQGTASGGLLPERALPLGDVSVGPVSEASTGAAGAATALEEGDVVKHWKTEINFEAWDEEDARRIVSRICKTLDSEQRLLYAGQPSETTHMHTGEPSVDPRRAEHGDGVVMIDGWAFKPLDLP